MENEKIVFEIDASSYINQLAQISTRIDTLKQKQADLRKAAQSGDAEAAKSLERVNLQLKNQEQAYASAQRGALTFAGAQKQGVDVTNFANNSIKVNKELLAQLTAEYQKTAKPSEQLQQNIATLTNVLGEQEAGMTKNIQKTSLLQTVYGEVMARLKSAPGIVGASARAFEGVGKAIAAGTGPVGIIIEALKGLWDILQSNSTTAAEIQHIMAGVGKVFGKIAGDVVNFGKGFVEALSNPKKLLTDLGDLIKENIINRFKAFGVIITAIQNKDLKGLANGFLQMGTGVTNVTGKVGQAVQAVKEYTGELVDTFAKGYVAAKHMEAIEVTMAKLSAAIKRNEQEITSLTKKLKDKSLTEQEAAKIANQIADKEIENLQKAAKLKQLELDEQRKRYEQNRNDAQAHADFIDKTTEAEIAAMKVKAALQEKEATVKSLLAEKERQLAEDAREQERVKIELMEDGLEKRKALFEHEFKKEAEDLRKHNVSKEEIEALHKKQLNALIQNHHNEQLAEQIQQSNEKQQQELDDAEKSVGTVKEKEEEKQRIRVKFLKEQLTLLELAADADGQRSDEEVKGIKKVQDALDALLKKTEEVKAEASTPPEKSIAESLGMTDEGLAEAQEVLGKIEEGFQMIADTVSMYYSTRLQNIETTKQAELNAVEESTLSEKAKAKKKKEIEKKAAQDAYEIQLKQFKSNKAVAIIQAVINTAQAVMNAFATAGNIYAAIALAAVAAGTGAAQIGIIASQKPPAPPKFAKGIIGLPGPGTETSDSIPAYLSKGESVITARATKRFAPMLAQMEMSVGNIPNYQYSKGHFANGVIGDGGFYTRESVNNVQNNLALQEAITQGFRSAPQPVVSVQEITRVNNNVSRSVKVSEL